MVDELDALNNINFICINYYSVRQCLEFVATSKCRFAPSIYQWQSVADFGRHAVTAKTSES